MTAITNLPSSSRYGVSTVQSWISFEARSSLHSVKGKAMALTGFLESGWDEDGTVAAVPPPKMHVEFPVEQMRSGNGLQDREMWKIIDSTRFPRIVADLYELKNGAGPARYRASGDVTMSGRTRRYNGEMTVSHRDETVTVEGDLIVDIRDFGLKPPSMLMLKVDPIVKVHVYLVAKKAA